MSMVLKAHKPLSGFVNSEGRFTVSLLWCLQGVMQSMEDSAATDVLECKREIEWLFCGRFGHVKSLYRYRATVAALLGHENVHNASPRDCNMSSDNSSAYKEEVTQPLMLMLYGRPPGAGPGLSTYKEPYVICPMSLLPFNHKGVVTRSVTSGDQSSY